ncbi:MAG: signal peptide peptidase SppA [Paludibacteraceae bacterium]|nr:signal peptide peptidase SppA [Paludibacteraceae bacterium]
MKLFCTKKDGQPRQKLGCFGKTLIGIGIYFLVCALFSWILGDTLSTPKTTLEENTVYRIDMSGELVEQAAEDNPMNLVMAEMTGKDILTQVGLNDLLSNIALAKNNDKVLGIYLRGGELAAAPASAKALRDALLDFKESGKFVIAYADSYTQTNYYIVSVADKIYLNAVGSVAWDGLSAQKMYYTRLMEKVGVEMQILKVGTFKSAVEPYFRTSMSAEDRKQTEQYLNGIWEEMRSAVAQSRQLTSAQLDKYANEGMSVQPYENYVAYGLVDTLVYVQDMDTVLRQYTGTKDYKVLSHSKMTNVERAKVDAKDKVAVIYAEGQIFDGGDQGITDTEMIKIVNKIHKDEDVKAVVLRVNSPGGSADASEQIWHAVTTLQAKGMPVVVSMGDYAASGGYYISCAADYIYAEPTTLTGSIGIFGTVPNFKKIREKVGIDMDAVSTHKYSTMTTGMVYRGMSKDEHAIMQSMVERGYDLFTSRCADGRGMTQDAIKAVGEGRVWLGKDAVKLGLVDELGNINSAIQKAAELAELQAYQLSYYPEKKDPLQELLKMLDNSTPEERLIMNIREFASEARIMALMPEVTIQ